MEFLFACLSPPLDISSREETSSYSTLFIKTDTVSGTSGSSIIICWINKTYIVILFFQDTYWDQNRKLPPYLTSFIYLSSSLFLNLLCSEEEINKYLVIIIAIMTVTIMIVEVAGRQISSSKQRIAYYSSLKSNTEILSDYLCMLRLSMDAFLLIS